MNDVIYFGVGVVVGAILALVITRKNNDHKIFDQVITVAKDKLAGDKEEIKTDLANKRDQIKDLITEIRRELKLTEDKVAKNDERIISSFSSLKNELETYKQLTSELRGSTDDLKKVLSNNQMRGAFGERVAEDLLKMAGFVNGFDYLIQSQVGPNRPDVTILLPDKTKVNIDVKFPYSNLQKYTETQNKNEKNTFMEQFRKDVKEKIKQVATREYINPEEQTVDFAIVFIPSEMIFSFIYDQLNDVWEDAMSKKIILAGPYSFTALLRLIKQAHSNFQVQTNIVQIINLIGKFKAEYEKFNEEFEKVGKRIDEASKQFTTVATTRTRQLSRVIDQIDNQENLDSPKPPKLIE